MPFCIYEIDTPRGHITGHHFHDDTHTVNRNSEFQPACLQTITLAEFGQILAAYCTRHDIAHDSLSGHITTNDGHAFSISDIFDATPKTEAG